MTLNIPLNLVDSSNLYYLRILIKMSLSMDKSNKNTNFIRFKIFINRIFTYLILNELFHNVH